MAIVLKPAFIRTIDLNAPGVLRTPERYGKAMPHLLGGYELSAGDVVGEGILLSVVE